MLIEWAELAGLGLKRYEMRNRNAWQSESHGMLKSTKCRNAGNRLKRETREILRNAKRTETTAIARNATKRWPLEGKRVRALMLCLHVLACS